VVILGGWKSADEFRYTWTWSAAGWKRSTVTSPTPRAGAIMGYDRAHGQVVLFGDESKSISGFAYLADTLDLGWAAWKLRSLATLPSLEPWPRRGRLIMFGGAAANGASFNANWSWDGNDWTLENPANSPPARRNAGMAFEEARRVIVLFGGTVPGQKLSDTGTYDGSTWTEQHPATDPGGGWARLAYEPTTRRLVGLAQWVVTRFKRPGTGMESPGAAGPWKRTARFLWTGKHDEAGIGSTGVARCRRNQFN
jgi:hypothetical protein